MITPTSCHCGSSFEYQNCCQKFINQSPSPKTAEQLMRSRFTAFKLKIYNYLIDTTFCKESEQPLKVNDFDVNPIWLGLKIISTEAGNPNDQRGTVEFVAFYYQSPNSKTPEFIQLHEKSYFEKINGLWLYINGDPLPKIKLSRNDACFCNSGKKFKKCHGI